MLETNLQRIGQEAVVKAGAVKYVSWHTFR
jgi:hypothetical protein